MTLTRHCGDIQPQLRRYFHVEMRTNGTAPMMLKKIADVRFPTSWATFRLLGFEGRSIEGGEKGAETALALTLGEIHSSPPVVRIHSQCTTGDVFHSLRCDCHDQLHLAMRRIAQEGSGVLVYEFQEGRGIGLMEKLRAYELQDNGLDTIEANLRLGHAVDLRSFRLPVEVLRFLGIRSLRLMTNNPEKIDAVQSAGIRIRARLDADIPATADSARYLETKRQRLGHLWGAASGLPVGRDRAEECSALASPAIAPELSPLFPDGHKR